MQKQTMILIGGLALVLIAALFLQQTFFKPTEVQASPLALQEKTIGSACETGENANFNCNANTLSFLTCENGIMTAKTRDCAPAVCKPDSTGASCVQDITSMLGLESKQPATATLKPTAQPTQQAQKWIEGGSCGDGICSTKENCGSCTSDCACKAKEFCDTRYGAICRPVDACGDAICSNNEKKNSNCCQDCGCATGFCPTDKGVCVNPLSISADDITVALSKRFFEGFEKLYEGDYAEGGKTFKEIVLTDSIGIMHFVYLNSTGQVEFEVAST
ncbi:MAG: hypothetical protein V1811_01145 [Candidatus Micrarchaeota archaeon]